MTPALQFPQPTGGVRCVSLLLGAARLGGTTGRFAPDDEAAIRQITRAHFPGGFTVQHAEGGWFDPRRERFVREASRQVLILTSDWRRVLRWAQELGRALGQEELVLVELGVARRLRIKAPRSRRRARPAQARRR